MKITNMKISRFFIALACVSSIATSTLMAGCGQNVGASSSMSADEEKHFKGGPMPPEAIAASRGGAAPPAAPEKPAGN